MANPATEFTIQAKVVGADQVEGLKSAVQSLRNRAIPAAEDISKLRDAAKSLGNAAEASTSDLRTSVTVLKSLKDQVALTSKEYRDLSNDLKTVENRFNAANTAAKQFKSSAGPLGGGTAGAAIMGRPAEKLDPYVRLGFETNDPEYWRRKQQNIGGPQLGPQQLDYAATTKGLTGLESALDQMNDITNRKRQERLQLNAKYNQLEIEQQDAAHKKSLQIEKRNDDLDLEDFDRRLNQRVAIREEAEQAKAKRRQRLASATQSVGAVAAAGVFGGPEGAIGAALGAFGGPQGALIGGAIGAQVGMLRQSAAGVAEYATQLTLAKITLAQASTGIQQYNQQLQIARNVSKDYSVGLLETINGYAQVAIAAKANGLSVAQTENIYRGVIATGVAFGKSQEDISAIVRATTQILSKAKVTAEELGGQLGERIPGAVAKFAEKTGRSLPGLAKDLEQGKVTIADFVAFTKGQLDDYDKIARIIGESPEKAGARLKIALDTAAEDYGGFFQTIGAQFQDFATRLISWVNENSEAIKRFVTFAANNFINLIAGIDLLIGKIEEIPKAFEKYLPKVIKAQFEFSVFDKDRLPEKLKQQWMQYTNNYKNIFPEFKPTDAMFGVGAGSGIQSPEDKEKAITDIKQRAIIQLRELNEQTEEKIADMREATIKRSIELERNFNDQRLKAEREIQDLRNRSNELNQSIVFASQRLRLESLGLGTEGVDAAEKINNIFRNYEKEQTQIQRTSQDNKIQRERQLEQFKTTTAEQIGKMQIAYTRSVADILQKTGDNLKEKMIDGANEVRKILGEISTGQQAPAFPVLPDPTVPVRPTNQQANSRQAGVGMVITPEMTRPLRGQLDPSRGQSDVVTHRGIPAGQGMQTAAQLDRYAMRRPGLAAQNLQGKQEIAANVKETNNLQTATLDLAQQRREALRPLNEQKKNLETQLETQQRLYDLISGGLNPALADQIISIERSSELQKNQLINARDTAIAESNKKGISEEQRKLAIEASQNAAMDLINTNSTTEALKLQVIELEKASVATTRIVNEKQRMKDLVQGINTSIESGMVSAIDSAITGAKSLQDVMSSVLKDIGQMLISFGVKSLLNSFLGPSSSILSGGGFNAGTSTAFGGGIPGLDMGQFGGIKMFAAGGNPPVGKPSLVGEKGPELFVPRTAGTIVPADATAAAMARYQRQGGGSGAGGSGSDAMAAGEATPVLSMSFETTRFMDRDWVDKDQLVAAMAATERRATTAGAKAGAAQVTSRLQQSPSYRRQVGLR